MKIFHLRVLLLVSVAVIVLITTIYVISANIMSAGFEQLEQQNTRRNVERAVGALSADLKSLDSRASDWSAWDEFYQFMQDPSAGPDSDFIKSNVNDGTFTDTNLDVIIFANANKQIVFSAAFDSEQKKQISIPPDELAARFSPQSSFWKHLDSEGQLTGIIPFEPAPLLLAARPILPSEGTGSSQGTLIFGRYLDESEISALSDTTFLTWTLKKIHDPALPADFGTALHNLTGATFISNTIPLPGVTPISKSSTISETTLTSSTIPFAMLPLNMTRVAGFTILSDIDDNPDYILRVDLPRNIYQQGENSKNSLLIVLVTIGLILGVVSYSLSVGLSNDITKRKKVEAELREAMDILEVKVAERTADLQTELAERKRYELIANTAGELMALIGHDGRYVAVNTAYSESLHKKRDDVIGQTISDILGVDVFQETIKPYLERCFAGQVVQFQTQLAQNGVPPRYYDVTYYPYYGTGEVVLQVVVVSHDITNLIEVEEALRASETRFKSLFENAPLPLWEEDFSLVALYLNDLRQLGVTDLAAYLQDHPDVIVNCLSKVRVVDINKSALGLYQAKSKEELLSGLGSVFVDNLDKTFKKQLIAIAAGETWFAAEGLNRTLNGDIINVAVNWSVAPGYEKTYGRMFVAITDITERLRAQEEIAAKVRELERHNRDIRLLNEMGDMLQTCSTVEESSSVMEQFGNKLFPNESGALYLTNSSRNFVEMIASWGDNPPPEHLFAPNDCWALRRGQPYFVNDPHSDLLCRHISHDLNAGCICVPMVAQGETLGILYLETVPPSPDKTLVEQELDIAAQQSLIMRLSEHLALALANLKLREALRVQAIRDPLTGLYNRRYMMETLERELSRAKRRETQLGIIMLDLDHFKQFNDTFGHAAGDLALRDISAFFEKHIRSEDIACRYGGEEFIIILPEVPLEDTVKRAEQLRAGVKKLHVRYHDQVLGKVTVSVGVACFPTHGTTIETIMRAADTALYSAKHAGRDCVAVAS